MASKLLCVKRACDLFLLVSWSLRSKDGGRRRGSPCRARIYIHRASNRYDVYCRQIRASSASLSEPSTSSPPLNFHLFHLLRLQKALNPLWFPGVALSAQDSALGQSGGWSSMNRNGQVPTLFLLFLQPVQSSFSLFSFDWKLGSVLVTGSLNISILEDTIISDLLFIVLSSPNVHFRERESAFASNWQCSIFILIWHLRNVIIPDLSFWTCWAGGLKVIDMEGFDCVMLFFHLGWFKRDVSSDATQVRAVLLEKYGVRITIMRLTDWSKIYAFFYAFFPHPYRINFWIHCSATKLELNEFIVYVKRKYNQWSRRFIFYFVMALGNRE